MAYEVFKPPRRRSVKVRHDRPGRKPLVLHGTVIGSYCKVCGLRVLHWPGCPHGERRTA